MCLPGKYKLLKMKRVTPELYMLQSYFETSHFRKRLKFSAISQNGCFIQLFCEIGESFTPLMKFGKQVGRHHVKCLIPYDMN